MTDIANLGIAIDTTDVKKATVALNELAGSGATAESATKKLEGTTRTAAESSRLYSQNMAGVAASMRNTASTSIELSKETQRILDRYDPLGTKLRTLQEDFKILRREMGNSTSDAAIKSFQGLEDEISKTRGLMVAAGVATEGSGLSMNKLGLNTQYARRELMQLGSEAINGNFSRMPRTFSALVTHSNILPALINPVGLAIAGVTAVVAAGAGVWYLWGQAAREAAAEAAKAAKDALKEAENLASSTKHMTQQEQVSDMERQIARLKRENGIINENIPSFAQVAATTRYTGPGGTAESPLSGQRETALMTLKYNEEAIANLERNRLDLLKQMEKQQDKADEAELRKQQHMMEMRAKEYADAQAKVEILNIEAVTQTKLTDAQKKLIVLGKEQEQGIIALSDAEYARAAANLSGVAAAEINYNAVAQAEKDAIEKTKQHTAAVKEWDAIIGKTDNIAKATQEWENMLRLQKELGLSDEQIAHAYAGIYKEAEKAAKKSDEVWKHFAENVQRNLGDVLYNAMNGKFNGIADLFKQMLLRMAADAAAANIASKLFGSGGPDRGIFGAILAGLGLAGNNNTSTPGSGSGIQAANGAAMYGAGIHAFSNQIVSTPTHFYANGGNVMGEAGPEAIMPLKRDSSGRLGVSGGSQIVLHDNTTINVDSRSDRNQILQDVGNLMEAKQAKLVDTLQRQGRLT